MDSTLMAWLAPVLTAGAVAMALGLALRFAVPRGRTRPVKAKVLLRALLPLRLVRSRSGRADICWFLFGIFAAGSLLGWALWSSEWFSARAYLALTALFGPPQPIAAAPWIAGTVMTIVLYVTYEAAYWLNHYLSHRVPALWEFHKVHHTAESLSTLTNFRVHPVDTIVFYNMIAVATGLSMAMVNFGFGQRVEAFTIGGSNLMVVLATILLTHLQHSHLWISLSGRAGRWILSPAHHQIHHSVDERHHDRNFGSTLAVFDRLFGTLHVPTAKRERLRFGVDGLDYHPHGAAGSVLMPFIKVGGRITEWARATPGFSVVSRSR